MIATGLESVSSRPWRQSSARFHGIFLADACIGTALVFLMLTLLGFGVTSYTKVSQRAATQQAAMRVAEAELLRLQTGESLPTAPASVTVSMRQLPDASAATGYVWTEVSAALDGSTVHLVGLVPIANVEKRGAP